MLLGHGPLISGLAVMLPLLWTGAASGGQFATLVVDPAMLQLSSPLDRVPIIHRMSISPIPVFMTATLFLPSTARHALSRFMAQG